MDQIHMYKKEMKGREGKPEKGQLIVEIPETVMEQFQDAVEKNGKTMKDVLKLYMQKYIWKQSELQRNRQKRRQTLGNN